MRLIDADKLWDVMNKATLNHIVTNTLWNTLKSVVENAPTVNEWIPVSERLPENSGCVLISIAGDIEFGAYDRQNSDWAIWRDGYWDEGKRADAWMPLPPSYQGE